MMASSQDHLDNADRLLWGYVMQNDALAHVESFLLPIPVASKSINLSIIFMSDLQFEGFYVKFMITCTAENRYFPGTVLTQRALDFGYATIWAGSGK